MCNGAPPPHPTYTIQPKELGKGWRENVGVAGAPRVRRRRVAVASQEPRARFEADGIDMRW